MESVSTHTKVTRRVGDKRKRRRRRRRRRRGRKLARTLPERHC